MVFARFAPKEVDGNGNPLFIMFIGDVNVERPGTFGAPEFRQDFPYPGYETEEYPDARVIHGPGDEGIRVAAKTKDVLPAFRQAAVTLGIHIAGLENELAEEDVAPHGYCIYGDGKPVTHWSSKPVTPERPRPDVAGVCTEHAEECRQRGDDVMPAHIQPHPGSTGQ